MHVFLFEETRGKGGERDVFVGCYNNTWPPYLGFQASSVVV